MSRTQLVFLACLAPLAASAQEITVPEGFYERPERVRVLPVFLAPSDQMGLIPDPDAPGRSLTGNPLADPDQYEAAATNLMGQLQVAQAVYDHRLSDPISGDSRGTFEIAAYNQVTRAVEVFDPTNNDHVPYLHLDDQKDWAHYGNSPDARETAGAELLDAFGCERYNCPFVFLTFLVSPDDAPGGVGGEMNYGYNGGGGVVVMPYIQAATVHTATSGNADNMLSTLLHELGHSFGLQHNYEPYPGDLITAAPNCGNVVGDIKYSKLCSSAIMSQNPANHTANCEAVDGLGYCALPANFDATTVPGTFLPEDIRDLAQNQLVFPGLSYDPLIEDPGVEVLPHPVSTPGNGSARLDLEGHPAIEMTSPHSQDGTPYCTLGAHMRPVPPASATFDGRVMWRSTYTDSPEFTMTYPEPVTLSRFMISTQSMAGAADMHRSEAVQIQARIAGVLTTIAEVATPMPDVDIVLDAPVTSTEWRFEFQSGPTGQVDVRGLRSFTPDGELFASLEPEGTSIYGETYGSLASNIVGADQGIAPSHWSWDPDSAWHSEEVAPQTWVSVDVTFPEPVTVAHVELYSGYAGEVHAVSEAAISVGVAGGFSPIYSAFPEEAHMDLYPPTTTAKSWRIGVKTGDSGHAVLRGLRFFDDMGVELFPARRHPAAYTNDGETYGSSVNNVLPLSEEAIPSASDPYDATTMWHSKFVGAGNWASVVVEFDREIMMSEVGVHSQHSGVYHRAERLRVEARKPWGYDFAMEWPLWSTDEIESVPGHHAKVWRLSFQAGPSGYVVLRGLEFWTAGSGEPAQPVHWDDWM